MQEREAWAEPRPPRLRAAPGEVGPPRPWVTKLTNGIKASLDVRWVTAALSSKFETETRHFKTRGGSLPDHPDFLQLRLHPRRVVLTGFFFFFNRGGKTHIMLKPPFRPFFRGQCGGIRGTDFAVRPSPSSPGLFTSCKTKAVAIEQPPSCPCPALGTHVLLSVSTNPTALETLYQWNRTVSVLL